MVKTKVKNVRITSVLLNSLKWLLSDISKGFNQLLSASVARNSLPGWF